MVNAEAALKRDWYRFEQEFIRTEATDRSHILITGDTRSGKTTTMFFLMERLIEHNPEGTYVWFELPKASESLTLSLFKPVQYIVPKGLDIEIKLNNKTEWQPFPIEIKKMDKKLDIFDPWKYLKPGYINIICIEPFVLKAKIYGPIISQTFENLIYRAVHEDIIRPLTVFIDEANNVAPSNGNAYDHNHSEAAKDFQHNVERLAGQAIQIIASTQMYTEMKFPVRKAVGGLKVIKRGATFPLYDEPRLWEATKHWQKLKPLQMVLVWRDHTYSECDLKIRYYPRGADLGHIKYIGDIESLKAEREPLPCEDCDKPHELKDGLVICNEFMQILNQDWLRTNGCKTRQEAS